MKPTDRCKQPLEEQLQEEVIVLDPFAVPAEGGGTDSP